MSKIELKHIAPYLPYGLKCEILDYKSDYVGEQYLIMKGYYLLNDKPHFNFHKGRDFAGKNTTQFKPILRPLYELHMKENFIRELIEEYSNECMRWILVDDLSEIKYSTFKLLIQYHYDVFGLINKGLAIDINTL